MKRINKIGFIGADFIFIGCNLTKQHVKSTTAKHLNILAFAGQTKVGWPEQKDLNFSISNIDAKQRALPKLRCIHVLGMMLKTQ